MECIYILSFLSLYFFKLSGTEDLRHAFKLSYSRTKSRDNYLVLLIRFINIRAYTTFIKRPWVIWKEKNFIPSFVSVSVYPWVWSVESKNVPLNVLLDICIATKCIAWYVLCVQIRIRYCHDKPHKMISGGRIFRLQWIYR